MIDRFRLLQVALVNLNLDPIQCSTLMTHILLQVPLAVGQVERDQPRRIFRPPVSENVGVSGSARERHQQLHRRRRHLQRRPPSQVSAQV